MLAFELFDENGKLNPRKVLFSAQTSPSRANSLLTTLFGGIMQWNARRWATDHMKNLIKTHSAIHPNTKTSISRLLEKIKQKGEVNRAEFFQLSTSAMLQEDFYQKRNGQPQTNGSKTVFPSETQIINRTEFIAHTLSNLIENAPDDAKPQELFNHVQCEKVTEWITQNISAEKSHTLLKRIDLLKKNDTPAHEIIATMWHESAKIPKASTLFQFQKDACESGFIDYCRGTPLAHMKEKLDALEKFLLNSDKDFSDIQKNYSYHQYATMIEAKNRLKSILPIAQIQKSEKNSLKNFDQYFEHRNFPDRDPVDAEISVTRQDPGDDSPRKTPSASPPNHAPAKAPTRPAFVRIDQPAHEFLEDRLNQAPQRLRGHVLFAFPRKAVDSGFTNYCRGTPLDALADRIDELEDFVVNNGADFDALEKALTPERYEALVDIRNSLYDDIQEYRKFHTRLHAKTSSAIHRKNSSVAPAEATASDNLLESSRQQLTQVNEWLKPRLDKYDKS